MDNHTLKEILTTYKNNETYLDASINLQELTKAMLREIGTIDPVLRDELIYGSFCNLILQDAYTETELKEVLFASLDDEHLFYQLGERETDSVFTRSFSSLLVALILYKNINKGFLSTIELEIIAEKLLVYVEREQDVRGLVIEKGWAHSIAHVADALDELVKQPNLSVIWKEKTFHAISNKMVWDKDILYFNENERMAIPIVSMIVGGFDEERMCETIVEKAEQLKQGFPAGDQDYFIKHTNFKQFLASVYFHLDAKSVGGKTLSCIKQAMVELNGPYYQL